MPSIEDVDEYEKMFMIQYVKQSSQKRIDELEKKEKSIEDSFKKLEIRRQIRIIREQTDKEIKEMENENLLEVEKVRLGEKSEELGVLNSENSYRFLGIEIPSNIWAYLFEYQREGVRWMIDLFSIGKGGVLADEMGLGKTIQIATFIIGLALSKKASRFLILSPVTVIDQWIAQLKELSSSLKIYKKISIDSDGVFIMSYESFRDISILPKFDCVFLDEGHKIKNKDAYITKTVKRINSQIKFVITGTPIQNNLGELWSIFDFVNPNLLGSYTTFQEEFESKIKSSSSENEKKTSYQHAVMLRSMIEPFVLRRMKHMIDHRHGKIDKVIFVSCSNKQLQLYCDTLESRRFKNCAIKGFSTSCSLLTAITFLRKICNHPILLNNLSFDNYVFDKTEADKNEASSQIISVPSDNGLEYKTLVGDSAKLKITFEMLDNWYTENHKVLLFFQSIKMLQVAACAITSFRKNYKFVIMTGATPLKQRSEIIKSFNTKPSIYIFLLTTKVGGLGINLTGADRVIIYDPDWNPSTDNQAKERVYRFGQKSNVEIYRLIVRDTLEEKIYQKQIYKDCLSKKILSNPDTIFDKEYCLDLFSAPSNFTKETEIKNNKMAEIVNDELVKINQEDTKTFFILKNYNTKAFLGGEELIEYIKRREATLG